MMIAFAWSSARKVGPILGLFLFIAVVAHASDDASVSFDSYPEKVQKHKPTAIAQDDNQNRDPSSASPDVVQYDPTWAQGQDGQNTSLQPGAQDLPNGTEQAAPLPPGM